MYKKIYIYISNSPTEDSISTFVIIILKLSTVFQGTASGQAGLKHILQTSLFPPTNQPIPTVFAVSHKYSLSQTKISSAKKREGQSPSGVDDTIDQCTDKTPPSHYSRALREMGKCTNVQTMFV